MSLVTLLVVLAAFVMIVWLLQSPPAPGQPVSLFYLILGLLVVVLLLHALGVINGPAVIHLR